MGLNGRNVPSYALPAGHRPVTGVGSAHGTIRTFVCMTVRMFATTYCATASATERRFWIASTVSPAAVTSPAAPINLHRRDADIALRMNAYLIDTAPSEFGAPDGFTWSPPRRFCAPVGIVLLARGCLRSPVFRAAARPHNDGGAGKRCLSPRFGPLLRSTCIGSA